MNPPILTRAAEPAPGALALAILTAAGDAGVGKTKLLKLLYLSDIEYFRVFRRTLTGFDWCFYLYGPWAPQYDELLQSLDHQGAISRRLWSNDAVEGEQITATSPVYPESLGIGEHATALYRAWQPWLERPLRELLDYVYFQTVPMEGAEKGNALNFNATPRERPLRYERPKSGNSPGQIAKIRRAMADLRPAPRISAEQYRPDPYDEVYERALRTLSEPEAD